jgi:SAM-dependent methyltransferase
MRETAIRLEQFYASPLGGAARDMAARRLSTLWPDLCGCNVLGYGYTWPYLAPYEPSANRLVLAMPEGQGAIAHQGRRGVATVLTQGQALPFSDATFDRILAVHMMEESETTAATLSELYRVLAPEGRIVIICANRSGMWARAEGLPFGAGRPYSRRQLKAALARAKFIPTVGSNALYIPPTSLLTRPSLLRGTERFGETVWPRFSGLVLVEAIKRLYAPSDNGHAQKVARPKFSGVPALNKTHVNKGGIGKTDV